MALLAAGSLQAAEPGRDEPKPAWRNGPVRYLLSPEEDKAYKGLKTDEERTKAISEFWAKRDPTPETPANEYRDDFYRRVDEANKQFNEASGPGWTTDRGRVLLVAGYPSARKPAEDRETWSYTQFAAVAELKDTKSVLDNIVFEKTEAGEYKLGSEGDQLLNGLRKLDPLAAAKLTTPKAASAAKPPPAPAQQAPSAAAPGGTAPSAAAPGGTAPAAGAPGAPPPPPLPAGVQRLREAALAAEPKADLGLKTVVRYFKAEDGSTRTVVVLALKKADLTTGPDGRPNAVLYARFLPQGVESEPVEFLDQELFSPYDNAAEGWLEYAFAWPLKKSRTYELRVAASDGPAGKIATHTETLALPDYRKDELLLSSVTLARIAGPPGPDAPPPDRDGFRIGALRLVPCVDPVLGPKDDLSFFYDVYGAKHDPANNRPALDVTYLFEKKESSGWTRRGKLPQPDQQEERLGYSIPAEAIAQWPAGDYRLTVQVKDKVASVETSARLEFTVKK